MMSEEREISRRGLLQNAIVAAGAAVAVGSALTTAAEASKLPKAAVGYQDHPHGSQDCGKCALFVASGSCRSVAGSISPHGWCHIYRPKA